MTTAHDTGTGPVIVLVPGLAATAAFLAGAAADLARDHRVVTVELPGHGDAPAGSRPATIELAAERIADTIAELDLRDLTLVGWSLGATVAYAYLERFGADRVTGLVSVEQTPRLITGKDWTHAAFGGLDAPGAKAMLEGAAEDPEAFVRTLVGSSFAAGAEPDPALLERLTAEALRCEPAAVRELLADVAVQDWRPWLSALTLPTLLVHGARSQVYPTGVGQWLAEAVTDSRLETFTDSGHLPFLEEPDRFTRTVRAFAAEHTAASVAEPEPERQP